MPHEVAPISVRPWTLNGISKRMIVSHYENNYGESGRTLARVVGVSLSEPRSSG
jgi:superoxide dismutase, Fe-Mn family